MLNLAILAAAALATPLGAQTNGVDLIVIEKAARRMTLYDGEVAVTSYRVALGFSPIGDKRAQGDGRTPEGRYRISGRNPKSQFHLSMRISYPDDQDRADAAARSVSPGGDIFIHGTPGRERPYGASEPISDWTLGCVAVTNSEIEEMWRLVPIGAAVEIRP